MLDNQIARTFISTHAPRTGSDDGRRRTSAAAKDFNPRSPHGERRHTRTQTASPKTISTHAPRTGSDGIKHGKRFGQRAFQPTLPARGATPPIRGFVKALAFQPTLPARGATVSRDVSGRPGANFNPRSPHGERLRLVFRSRREWSISTHAPRTGSDSACSLPRLRQHNFNPRSPHGERHD